MAHAWFWRRQEAQMDTNVNVADDLVRAIEEATTAINRFVDVYTEFEKCQAIDRSIGGLRVVAERWLDANANREGDAAT